MIGLLLAVACVPDTVNWTPTPTIQWDHADRSTTVLYRIYVRPDDALSWPWHLDIPRYPATAEADESAPGVLQPYALQRAVPDEIQEELVDVVIKAVSAENVESEPSNVIQVCMPRLWRGGPYE